MIKVIEIIAAFVAALVFAKDNLCQSVPGPLVVCHLIEIGPSCWEMLCGRIWVILVNKDTAYSRLLVMN